MPVQTKPAKPHCHLLPSPSQATPLTYTGTGLVYNNIPLVPTGPGGAPVVNGSAGPNALRPAPANVTAGGVYSVIVGSACRVEGPTSYMYCPADAPKNDVAEQFLLFPMAGSSLSPGTALVPGSSILIKSLQTGKYCRVVLVNGKHQILCDVDDAAGASTMTCTGTGFSYQGQGFTNYGSSQPLQLSGTPGQGMTGSLTPGGPDSCKAGTFIVASTAPGEQGALASANEAYVLTLSSNGRMTITERATGRVTLNSGKQSTDCKSPYQLVLLPNGLLVLRDKRGKVTWAGGAACSGNTSCYSYALQNDGQLVIRDGDDTQVWSSGASSPADLLKQIVSGGQPKVSCIHSGRKPAATHLASPSLQYTLLVKQQGAQLQLMDTATNSKAWGPTGTLPGQAPAKMCISAQGSLDLTGADTTQLWSSGAAGSQAAGPYTAVVSDDGCLDVLDGSCGIVWSNHDGRKQRRAPPPRRVTSSSGTSKASSAKPAAPSVSSSGAAGSACALQQGQPCGGVAMCGLDAPCAHMGCCAQQRACARYSDFTWLCS